MISFPKYDKYKDSVLDGLEKIPSGWEVLPLTKYVKSLVDYRGKTPAKVESGIFLVTAKNIKEGFIDYEFSQEYVATTKYSQIMSRGIPRIGDLLFTTEAPLGGVALVDREDIALAQRIIKFRLNEKFLLPEFAKYAMMSAYFQEHLSNEATGSTAQGIKASKLHKLRIITPPLNEQKQIVEFLDRKTVEIDEAIAHKQRLIELLQEQKAIVINQAVTKGLNPNVSMHDSGVQWLGEIPKHWEVWRSKRLFSQRKEYAQSDDVQLSATQAYGVIPQEEYEQRIGRKVTKIMQHLEKRRHVEIGDFVISMRSFQGGLERAWAKGCIRSSYVVLKPSEHIDIDFFSYVFKSSAYISALQSTASFIRDGQDLNFDNFCAIDLALPPIEEQRAIAKTLNTAVANTVKTVEEIRKEISLIQEFRQIIIANAVTGKIKV